MLTHLYGYISDPDAQAAYLRSRRPRQWGRPEYTGCEPSPPPFRIDHAKKAAFYAFGQNRGYDHSFIGPVYKWRTPKPEPAIPASHG